MIFRTKIPLTVTLKSGLGVTQGHRKW